MIAADMRRDSLKIVLKVLSAKFDLNRPMLQIRARSLKQRVHGHLIRDRSGMHVPEYSIRGNHHSYQCHSFVGCCFAKMPIYGQSLAEHQCLAKTT